MILQAETTLSWISLLASRYNVPEAELAATLQDPAELEREIVRYRVQQQQEEAARLAYAPRVKGQPRPKPPAGSDLHSRCVRSYYQALRRHMRDQQRAAREAAGEESILSRLARGSSPEPSSVLSPSEE